MIDIFNCCFSRAEQPLLITISVCHPSVFRTLARCIFDFKWHYIAKISKKPLLQESASSGDEMPAKKKTKKNSIASSSEDESEKKEEKSSKATKRRCLRWIKMNIWMVLYQAVFRIRIKTIRILGSASADSDPDPILWRSLPSFFPLFGSLVNISVLFLEISL